MNRLASTLPAHATKVVAARWLLAETLEPFWGAAGEHNGPLLDAVSLVERRCRGALRYPSDEACDAWLADLAAQLGTVEQQQEEAASGCGVALERLRERLTSPVPSLDVRLLSLAEQAGAVSNAAYTSAGLSVPAEVLGGWQLALRWGEFDKPGSISGVQALTDQAEFPDSLVLLRLVPSTFDLSSVKSMLYLLTHEFVCHVLQGPWSSERQTSDPASPFAEGWMDVAALRIFEQAAEAYVLAATPGPDPSCRIGLGPMALRASAQIMHERRIAVPSSSAVDRFWAGRRTGVDTARIGLQALEGLVGDPAEAERVFLRASVVINTSTLSSRARDLWVQRWHRRLLTDGGDPQALGSVLLRYAERGEPVEFHSSE